MFSLLMMLWCGGQIANAQEEPITVPTIFAIGDLHADLSAARSTLRLAGVIDANDHWIAKDIHVVQTGDITDRGPDGLQILEWFKRLEMESNGQLTILLGNHETMNLMGDWRYVSTEDLESFGGKNNRILAFQPDGVWRNWLLQHPVTIKIGETVFVHGGIHPNFAKLGVDGINEETQKAIRSGQYQHDILGSNGPLWFRDYILAPEESACPLLEKSLKILDVKRMVVGHTTQRNGQILSRCNHKIIVIDTGISAHYGGNTAFLKIEESRITAYYSNTSEVITENQAQKANSP